MAVDLEKQLLQVWMDTYDKNLHPELKKAFVNHKYSKKIIAGIRAGHWTKAVAFRAIRENKFLEEAWESLPKEKSDQLNSSQKAHYESVRRRIDATIPSKRKAKKFSDIGRYSQKSTSLRKPSAKRLNDPDPETVKIKEQHRKRMESKEKEAAYWEKIDDETSRRSKQVVADHSVDEVNREQLKKKLEKKFSERANLDDWRNDWR